MLPRPAVPTRALVATVLTGLVATTLPVVLATPASAAPKVVICHRTKAVNNPYRRISVRQNATNNSGHGGHDASSTSTTYPTKTWGDIIPGDAYANLAANVAIYQGTTRNASGTRPACAAQTAAEFYANTVGQVDVDGHTITSEEVLAELQSMAANEDAALLATLPGGTFVGADVSKLNAVSATTEAATSVGSTSAVLHGRVSSGSTVANAAFAYSRDPDMLAGVTVVAGTQGTTTQDRATSATLTNLSGGTQYWFRALGVTDPGTDGEGTLEGAVLSFTTTGTSPQTITLEAGPAGTYGDDARTVTATVGTPGSGKPVVVTSTTPDVCSVSGTSVALLAAGTCSLTATVDGDATYAPASATDSFVVARAPRPVTVADPGHLTAGGTATPLTVSYGTSGSPVLTSSAPSVCAVSSSGAPTVTPGAAGTCRVTVDVPQDSRYLEGSGHVDLVVDPVATVTKQAQEITLAALADTLTGATTTPVTATSTSGLAVTLTASGACTLSGAVLTSAGSPGSCTVTATQPGDDQYLPANPVARTMRVRQTQTVTLTAPARRTVTAGSFPAAATSTTPATITSTTPSVCTVTGSSASVTVTPLAVGACQLQAVAPESPTVTAATGTATTLVERAPAGLVLEDPADRLTTSPAFTLSTASGSSAPVVLAASPAAVCTLSGTSVTPQTAGTCTLTATQVQTPTHDAGSAMQQVTFTRAPANLHLDDPADRLATDAAFPAVVTTDSAATVTVTSATPGVCTVTSRTITPVAAGACTLVATQPADDVHDAGRDEQTLTLGLAPQTIAFDQPGAVAWYPGRTRDLAPQLSASSGLPVSLRSTTGDVCTAAGTVVTLRAPGACAVVAEQPGDAVWAAAPTVDRTLTSYVVADPVPAPSPSTSSTPTPSPTTNATPAPTATPEPTLTADPRSSASPTPSATPAAAPVLTTPPTSAAPSPAATPTRTPTPSPAAKPTPTATPIPGRDVPRAGLVPVPATLPKDGTAPVRQTVNTTRSALGVVAPMSTTLGAGVLRPGQAATLPGRFLFDFDSARLTPKGVALVKDLVPHLKGDKGVLCEGYTDYAGDAAHELDLSRRRSLAVCEALKAYGAKVGTATRGYGGAKPVVVGGRAPERHENRRVVVVVTK